VLDIIRKVTGAGQPAICVVFLWLFYLSGHVFIVPMFLNIPASIPSEGLMLEGLTRE
jgi:hypothetical protein